jgi:UDPglucose 6-dehydrogenase
LDPVGTRELVAGAVVIDGRNALDREAWTAAGWRYRGMGRS